MERRLERHLKLSESSASGMEVDPLKPFFCSELCGAPWAERACRLLSSHFSSIGRDGRPAANPSLWPTMTLAEIAQEQRSIFEGGQEEMHSAIEERAGQEMRANKVEPGRNDAAPHGLPAGFHSLPWMAQGEFAKSTQPFWLLQAWLFQWELLLLYGIDKRACCQATTRKEGHGRAFRACSTQRS